MMHLRFVNILKTRLYKGETIQNQLAVGAGGAFAVKLATICSAFLLQIFLARTLGIESFGIYIYCLAWMNFGALFGRLGMDTASVKFVASYKANNDSERLTGFLVFSNRIALLVGLFAGAFALGLFFMIEVPGKSTLMHPMWIACLVLIPLNALILTLNGQLRGFKCIVKSQAVSDLLRPVLIICGILLLQYSMKLSINANLALGVHAVSGLFVLIVMVCLIRRFTILDFKKSNPVYEGKNWILTALPFLGVAIANMIIAQADLLIIGSMVSPTEAGLFSPAKRIGNLITIVLTSVNTIAAPLFSELYSQGKMDDLQKAVRLSAKWIALFSVPCCLLVFVFAKYILLLYGSEFQGGFQVLQIIACSQLVNALVGPVGFLMMMSGYEKKAAMLMIICSFGNIGLNLLLIPNFGIVGAAWANFVTTILWNLILLIETLKALQINPTIFQVRRPFLR